MSFHGGPAGLGGGFNPHMMEGHYLKALHSHQIDWWMGTKPWFKWAISPEGYIYVAPCVTMALFVWTVWVFWRDLKRLAFKGMGPTLPHHRGAVLWLHGTGDSGSGFGFLRNMVSKEFAHVKWVLPDGPVLRLTAAYDGKKRAWFDIKTFPIRVSGDYSLTSEPQDIERLDKSIAFVHELLRNEIAQGVQADKIVLGGFSQGAALALWAAARFDEKLAGVVDWSGYAVNADELASVLHDSINRDTPHLCCHGSIDDKILPACGQKVCDVMREARVPVTQKVYKGMNHACCPEQIDDLKLFLRRQLG